jgi:DNA-binding IscR family transcriptional regulator
MPKPRKITSDVMALLEAEARRRAECLSNKELARLTGLSEHYVGNLLSVLRRELKDEREKLHVSRETRVA